MFVLLPSQVPSIGKTVLLGRTPDGAFYHLMRRDQDTFTVHVNGQEHALPLDYPTRSKSGFTRDHCKLVLNPSEFSTGTAKLVRMPHTYGCALKRWVAERGYSPKIIAQCAGFITEYRSTQSSYDVDCDNSIAHSGDWTVTKWELAHKKGFQYQDGTVAVLYYRPQNNCSVLRRARIVTGIVVDPERKAEALEWLKANPDMVPLAI